MKQFLSLIAGLALMLTVGGNLQAQDEKDPAFIKSIVEGKNYTFKAETALPQQGQMRQLTPEFDLAISGDSVISYLPYFGRAFTAPVNPTDGGIKFISTDFDYKSVAKKKGAWEITINPKDAGGVQQLNLTIYDNGRASLRVNDRNRQGISFNGYIIEGKNKQKKAF